MIFRLVPLLATALAGSFQDLYAPVPHAGFIFKSCIHSIPAGATIERDADGASVAHAGGTYRLPLCKTLRGTWPMFLSSEAEFKALGQVADKPSETARKLQLPADYDGWLEYANTTYFSTGGYSSFLGTFTVPSGALPPVAPQELYLFTGLQNIDWIPKVDPQPTDPFDIIQPVLQYPGDNGNYWSVKSWWVTLDIGAQASIELRVKPGDVIFGNMTRVGKGAWFIDSVNQETGQHTSLTARGSIFGDRLDVQPWAYVTLECYGCTSCKSYPQGSSVSAFADMVLTSNSNAVVPTWQANAKPAKKRFCQESITLTNATNIEIAFGA